jgi:5'-nucleotidase
MKEGPFAAFLRQLALLQQRLPMAVEYSPVRLALVTARNAPAELRAILTLRRWGIYVDEAFFLGGVGKAAVLSAFGPHLFFDDQDVHLAESVKRVPCAKVLYPAASRLAALAAERLRYEEPLSARVAAFAALGLPTTDSPPLCPPHPPLPSDKNRSPER